MNFINTVLRLLTIVSAFGLSGDQKHVSLTARKIKFEDGSEVLFFNCSSPKRPKLPYVEFLVNNKSIASSIYILRNGKCVFRHLENNCTNKCQCKSDGKTFTWTFPVPSLSRVLYSCQMFVVSKTTYEQSHILYNGTDFLNTTKDEESGINNFNLTTAKDDVKYQEDEVQEENTALTVALVIVCIVSTTIAIGCLGCVIWKKRKQGTGHQNVNLSHRAGIGDNENDKLLHKTNEHTETKQTVQTTGQTGNEDLKDNTLDDDNLNEISMSCPGYATSNSFGDEPISNKTDHVATPTLDKQTQTNQTVQTTGQLRKQDKLLDKTNEPTKTKQTVQNATQTRFEDFKDNTHEKDDAYGLKKLFEEETKKAGELCSVCSLENIKEKAEKLCLDCGAELCSHCNIRHVNGTSSRKHKTCDKKTICKGIELLYTCKLHGRTKLNHVCRTHNEIVCLQCMITSHKQCRKEHLAVVVEDSSSLQNKIASFSDHICEVLGLLITIQVHLESNMRIITKEAESSKQKLKTLDDKMLVKNTSVLFQKLKNEEKFLKSRCHADLKKVSEKISTWEKHKEVLEFTKQHGYQMQSYICMLQIQKELETLHNYTFNMKNNFVRPGIQLNEDSGVANIKVVENHIAIANTNSVGQRPLTQNILKYEIEIETKSSFSNFEILPDETILCVDGLNSKVIRIDKNGVKLDELAIIHTPYDISVIPNSANIVLTDRFEDILMFTDQETTHLVDVRTKAVEGSKSCTVSTTTEYIVLGGQKLIMLLNHSGENVRTISVSNDIRAISCFDEKYYYVCFGSNQVFTVSQNEDEEICVGNEIKAPIDIKIDNKGNILVLDKGPEKMFKFSSCGVRQQLLIYGIQELRRQTIMRFSSDFKKIYVLNNGGFGLSVFNVN